MTDLLRRTALIVWFPFFYGFRVVVSSLRVAWDILTPGSAAAPAFVEVPLNARTDLEVTAIANMISLTPGTFTMATRLDPPTLWIHGLYTAHEQDFLHEIHQMEDYLLGITRPHGAPARTDTEVPR
ncbi:Na+/H+ antiporter subunit E [Nocardiopsis sp. N85]|uniref:Na+/H+ antiporter subunit E n=1 Tax=Nocardiopsis sp. N85 TaxID=3029400 RepID=UPI00237FB0C3|nr:Na+/H+ antiporter subunit E [Nocardiopsis sp. N85]MDE3722612.1 Na+/H+ antiporter subunit E [Nocardiopsis sp. N85]